MFQTPGSLPGRLLIGSGRELGTTSIVFELRMRQRQIPCETDSLGKALAGPGTCAPPGGHHRRPTQRAPEWQEYREGPAPAAFVCARTLCWDCEASHIRKGLVVQVGPPPPDDSVHALPRWSQGPLPGKRRPRRIPGPTGAGEPGRRGDLGAFSFPPLPLHDGEDYGRDDDEQEEEDENDYPCGEESI